MKALILGFAAIAVIAVGADQVLHRMGWSAAETGTSSGSVRLGD
jgi:hypothetical protein